MNVELNCSENRKFTMEVVVHALTFDTTCRTFTVPLCAGDDWYQTIGCPIRVEPTKIHLQWQKAFIEFEREQDARAFGEWLVEAEVKAQDGYRTMRG
jgi:hypothetical protein